MKTNLFLGVILALMCSFTHQHVSAQAESKEIGYRPHSSKVAVVYPDRAGVPDTDFPYFISSDVYIKRTLEEITINGEKYVLILLPGNAGDPMPYDQSSRSQDWQTRQVNSENYGRGFWILESYFSNDGKYKDFFRKQYIRSRWVAGFLTVPFKYRFSYKTSASLFTPEATLGPSLGWKFWRSSQFSNSAGIVGAAGLTLINPNYAFADENEERKDIMAGATACIGINLHIGKTQLGLLYGHDWASDTWEFHGQPWVSFAIGFNFWSNENNTKDAAGGGG